MKTNTQNVIIDALCWHLMVNKQNLSLFNCIIFQMIKWPMHKKHKFFFLFQIQMCIRVEVKKKEVNLFQMYFGQLSNILKCLTYTENEFH